MVLALLLFTVAVGLAGCRSESAPFIAAPVETPQKTSIVATATAAPTEPARRETDCHAGACPAESQKRCGDGVCDGPESPDNCPGDCGLPTPPPAELDPGEAGPAAALAGSPGQRPGVHWVRNPRSGIDLFVRVVTPVDWDGAAPLAALVLVPGGRGAGSTFLADPEGQGSDAQHMADQAGVAVVAFDPDGRGQSGGEEDDGGFVHQDGLAAVIRYVAGLPEIDSARIGIASYSYGVTMATGALARHPDLPVRFLIDREGPADRNDTGGCDEDQTGHLQDVAACDDEAFWAEREAATFAPDLPVPYQRLQSRDDHAQPDLAHAILMLENATATAYGGRGVSPWTRLNGLAPNTVYTAAILPHLPPPGSPAVIDIAAYARDLFDRFAPAGGEGARRDAGPNAGQADGADAGQADAPLFLTTMTHMEGSHTDDRERHVFDTHVAQLRYGLALANEYGARFTVESEMPFARACAKWSHNMLQEVIDLGHGVGTHADVGFINPPPNATALAQELRHRKALVDALVGPEQNRGVSGAGGVNDWVLAAAEAGFRYVDGIVGMHYMAMPLTARPDALWTNDYIREFTYHDPAPVDFVDRIHPFLMRDARDFEPDADGIILLSSGEIGRLDAMAEGSPERCIRGECPFAMDDVAALEALIAEAAAVHEPSRIAKLTLYMPANLFVPENEALLRAFLASAQSLADAGTITWATQGEVYDAWVGW